MPGLIRGVARTAAVVGTATVVSNGVSRRQRGRWAADEQQQAAQQAPPPAAAEQPAPAEPAPAPVPVAPTEPAAVAPAADNMTDKLTQLTQLGELKTQGILTDEEFEAQKKKILGT